MLRNYYIHDKWGCTKIQINEENTSNLGPAGFTQSVRPAGNNYN